MASPQTPKPQEIVGSEYSQFLKVVKSVSVVNGIEVPIYIKQEHVDEIVSHFQLESSDIWITSYPKAGTTWAQQVVKLIRNKGESDDVKITESIP